MVTATEEPQVKVKTMYFDSIQSRVEQIHCDIAAANKAVEAAEERYRQIPNDKKSKPARAKASEALNQHRKEAEILRRGLSLEEAEFLLDDFMKKAQGLRQEFESMRNRAEKLVSDIAAAKNTAESYLTKYREHLHEGEKAKADKALVSVSKYRKKADHLRKQLSKVSKEDGLKRRIQDLYLQVSTLIETGILLDLNRRLQAALNIPGLVGNNCRHTLGDITKLEDFIK